MENKLEQLTRKLYDEGLAKGQQEAEALVAKAQSDAAKIVAQANEEAERIVKQAKQSAEELKSNTQNEVALASRQSIGVLKETIEGMIVASSIKTPVAALSLDSGFVKDMLLAVAANWEGSSSSKGGLIALLPEAKRKEFDAAFEKSAKAIMDAGVELKYSNNIKSGFRIGPKEGGYHISFTDADFEALLSDYLRPKLTKILYQK